MLKGRRQERTRLIYHLRVFDAKSNKLLGHMTDITPEGMMLIGESPVRVGRQYTLRMDLPRNVMEGRHLVFSAESKWCRKDGGEEFYSMGFSILAIDGEGLAIVRTLIKEFYQEELEEDEDGADLNPAL